MIAESCSVSLDMSRWCWFLPHFKQILDMIPYDLEEVSLAVILNTKLCTCFLYYWRNERIIRLQNVWKQMMCHLMIKCTRQYCAQPRISIIIYCACDLKFSPVDMKEDSLTFVMSTYHLISLASSGWIMSGS